MSYIKQNFEDGQILDSSHLNHIEEGIINVENKIPSSISNYWSGKKMIWNGDSISYGSWLSSPSSDAYPFLVGKSLGMNVINFSIGGSGAAKPIGSFEDYYWDLSKWNNDVKNGLVDTSKKYLVKDAPSAAKPCKIYYYNGSSWVSDSTTGYWAIVERMKEMVALHPDADVIGIAIGTNDFYTAACEFGETDAANYRNLIALKESNSSSYETIEQISDINLVDDLVVVDNNKELTKESSVAVSSDSRGIALMVPVKPNTKYYSPNAGVCWFFNSNKEAIESFDFIEEENYILIPENVNYISLTFLMSDLQNDTAGLYEVLQVSTDDRENLILKGILKDNYSLSSSSYSFTANESYFVYDQIPILGGKNYETSIAFRAWFLDSNKKSISTINISSKNNKFTAPLNASYISISFYKERTPDASQVYVKCIDDNLTAEESNLTKSTFCGAIHTICKYLCENYKNKDIFFVTPIKRYQPGSWDCKYPEDKNKLGYTLKDYVDAIKNICEYYSIPVIDLYSLSGLNPHIDTSLFADNDGKAVHPNKEGHERMASIVTGYLSTFKK